MTNAIQTTDAVLDRECEQRREPGFLETVLANDSNKVVLFHRGKALVSPTGGLAYLDPAQVPAHLPAGTLPVFLGRVLPDRGHSLAAGTELVLLALPHDAAAPEQTAQSTSADQAIHPSTHGAGLPGWVPAGTVFAGYREAAAQLNAADSEVFIQAQAVAAWHASHLFCPRCGGATESSFAGWMRRCVTDGSENFPRTDPAVIVAIVGADERILLASNFAWNENRYSTVAGFVEAGEGAEAGAVREIAEEVGVHLHALEYCGSQAWPFPRSLMLGFIGHTRDTAATPDLVEVREARWFGREELQAAVLAGTAVISPRPSIARKLIEHWYGGRIVEPGEQA